MSAMEQPVKRMLIIDDDRSWCEIVKTMAKGLGYVADSVNTPEDAYRKLEKARNEGMPYRLAIVDMRFDVGEYNISLGRDVIKTIKDCYPETACLLSSGEKFRPADVLDLRDDYGLDYYLAKTDIERDALNYAMNRALEVNMILRKLRATDMPRPVPAPLPGESGQMPGSAAPKLFISYSHKDEVFKDELAVMLRHLQRHGVIDAWQDRRIEPGSDWLCSIQQAMEQCQIALLLVSGDFLVSEFITGNELPTLFQRRKISGMRAIPIIVRDCLWQSEPILKDLQALPRDGKPIISFLKENGDRDHAWTEIAKAIESLIEKPV